MTQLLQEYIFKMAAILNINGKFYENHLLNRKFSRDKKVSILYENLRDASFINIGQRITEILILFVLHDHFSPLKQC
jgi:hypothetical protein